jgi:DNA polymerase (family 10)
MDSQRVAQILEEMGTLLELRGENPFRCRAYHTAAQAVRGLPDNLNELLTSGQLANVAGIGETMLEKISKLVSTGQLASYDELKQQVPPGLVSLLRVPGLGPKKIKTLHEDLKISSLEDLKTAAKSGLIAQQKGFGAKTAQKILEGLAFIEKSGDRILQSTARRLADPLLHTLRETKHVLRAEACGSLRRRAETIGDLDLLFAAADPEPVLTAFAKLPQVESVLAHGPTKLSVRLREQVQCDVRGVSDDQFPFALNYFTGSKAHNIALRRRAQLQSLKLSEYALESDKGPVACADEIELYQALGLDYIEPELREDSGEIEAAETHRLPELVALADLTGTFHCHTDWSDGGATLEQMADAAAALGLKYLGIADHSRSATYAGGLSIERVREQWDAIDALNKKLGKKIRLFKGIECDILPDGSLDYPDDILAQFDYVVVSVHSSFGLSKEEMTRRVCRALAHPSVTMLGHPTGRLLLARDGYAIDLDAVIQAAAQNNKMIEINASPHRLDLDATHCRRAMAAGISIVINPDAHSTGEIGLLDYGVGIARRGWLTASDIFNTRSTAEVAKTLHRG